MDKYEVVCEIGKGSFGTVSKIKRKSDKKKLIWKELKYEGISDKEKQLIINEINLLKEMNHPNIVKQYETINDERNFKLYIVMEYCDGGDLDKLILKNKFHKKLVDEKLIWDILIQILRALYYIHNEKKILHRDIKPSNIFLDKDYNIKLGDFGLSKKFINEYSNTIIGTPIYMSPEILERKPYNVKADIWALGCSLYELATFSTPYKAPNMNVLLAKIRNGLPPRINKTYSDELWNIISKMLTYDYNKRPSSLELIEKYDELFYFKNSINNNDNDNLKKYKQLYLFYKEKCEKIEKELIEKEKVIKKREDLINKKTEEQNKKEAELNKKQKELKEIEENIKKNQKMKEMNLKLKERDLNNKLNEIIEQRKIIENYRNKYTNNKQNGYSYNGDNNYHNLLNYKNINNDNRNNNYEFNNNNNINNLSDWEINKKDVYINNEEINDELMTTKKTIYTYFNINNKNNKNKTNLINNYNSLDLISYNDNLLDGKDQNNESNDNSHKYLNNNQINSKNDTNKNLKELIKNNYHYYSNNNQNKDDTKSNFNYNDENILEQIKNGMNQEYNKNLINQNNQKENNEKNNQIYFNNFPNFENNERINMNENEENEGRTTLQNIDQLIDSKKKKRKIIHLLKTMIIVTIIIIIMLITIIV